MRPFIKAPLTLPEIKPLKMLNETPWKKSGRDDNQCFGNRELSGQAGSNLIGIKRVYQFLQSNFREETRKNYKVNHRSDIGVGRLKDRMSAIDLIMLRNLSPV